MTPRTIATTCSECGAPLEVDAECVGRRVRCGACGEVFVAVPDRPAPRARRRRRRPKGDGQAVAALVLGIISVLIFCLWPVGLITSGIGAACGFRGLRTPYRRMAVAGLVLSVVGLIYACGFAVLTAAVVVKVVTEDRGPDPSVNVPRVR